MFVHDRIPNFPPRRVRARANARWEHLTVAAVSDRRSTRTANLSFYLGNDFFRFIIAAMNHQPAWTLRNPAPEENHDEPQGGADSKCESPPEPRREIMGIEQNERCRCAHRSSD